MTKPPKPDATWTGKLAEPITLPLPRIDGSSVSADTARLMVASSEKMELLADHYGIKQDGPAGWGYSLALRLAHEFHPAFQVVYDHPAAQALGLPVKNTGGRPRGTSGAYAEISDAGLAIIVDFSKKVTGKSDRQICEDMLKAKDPELEKPNNKTELRKATTALQRRVSAGRNANRESKG